MLLARAKQSSEERIGYRYESDIFSAFLGLAWHSPSCTAVGLEERSMIIIVCSIDKQSLASNACCATGASDASRWSFLRYLDTHTKQSSGGLLMPARRQRASPHLKVNNHEAVAYTTAFGDEPSDSKQQNHQLYFSRPERLRGTVSTESIATSNSDSKTFHFFYRSTGLCCLSADHRKIAGCDCLNTEFISSHLICPSLFGSEAKVYNAHYLRFILAKVHVLGKQLCSAMCSPLMTAQMP